MNLREFKERLTQKMVYNREQALVNRLAGNPLTQANYAGQKEALCDVISLLNIYFKEEVCPCDETKELNKTICASTGQSRKIDTTMEGLGVISGGGPRLDEGESDNEVTDLTEKSRQSLHEAGCKDGVTTE